MLENIERVLSDDEAFEDVCASLLAKYGEVPDGWPELELRSTFEFGTNPFSFRGVVLYATVIFLISTALICTVEAYNIYQLQQERARLFGWDDRPQAADPVLPNRKRPQKAIDDLRTWITMNGGQADKIWVDSNGALRAAQAMKSGEAILSIPTRLQLTNHHAAVEIAQMMDLASADKEAKAITGKAVPEDMLHCDKWPSYVPLALYVMVQRADPNALWHVYTRMLPERANPLPVHYTPAQLALLQDSPMRHEAEATRTALEDWFSKFCMYRLIPSICECDDATEVAKSAEDGDIIEVPSLCGFDRFLWAWGAVRSRSFGVGAEAGGGSGRLAHTRQREQREQQQAQEEQQCDGHENAFEQIPPSTILPSNFAMAPLADMANHGVPTSATYLTAITTTPSLIAIAENLPFDLPFDLGGGDDEKAERRSAAFMLITTRDLAKGQQILIDYGERPGMLLCYGFQPDRTGLTEVPLSMYDTPLKTRLTLSLTKSSIDGLAEFFDLCSQQSPRPLTCQTGGKQLVRDLQLMQRLRPETAFTEPIKAWVFDEEIETHLQQHLQEGEQGSEKQRQGQTGRLVGEEDGNSLVVSCPESCNTELSGQLPTQIRRVWGNGEYYAASSLCAAGIHAHGDEKGKGGKGASRQYRIRFGTCSFQEKVTEGVDRNGIQSLPYSPALLSSVGEHIPGIGVHGQRTVVVGPDGEPVNIEELNIAHVADVHMDQATQATLLKNAQEAAKTVMRPTKHCFTVELLGKGGGAEGGGSGDDTSVGAELAGWSTEGAAFLQGLAQEDVDRAGSRNRGSDWGEGEADQGGSEAEAQLRHSRIFRGFVRTALEKLKTNLEKYGSTVEEDEALLSDGKGAALPFVDHNCILTRLWEKRVLRWHIRLLESFVDVMEGRWLGNERYVVMQVPSSWRGAGSGGGSERVASSIVVPTWLAKDREFGAACGVRCLRLFGKAKAAWLAPRGASN
jgi:hypothetical protein